MAGRKNSRTSKTDHVLSLLAPAAPESAQPAPAKVEPARSAEREESTPAPARERARSVPAQERAQSAAASSAPVRHTLPPILEVARANQEALSETIREALEESLAEELAEQVPPAPPESPVVEEPPGAEEPPVVEKPSEAEALPVAEAPLVGEEPPEAEELPVVEVSPEMEEPQVVEELPEAEEPPLAEEPLAPEAPAAAEGPSAGQTPPAAPAPPESGPGKTLEDGSVFINVMEVLVEERLEKYVKLFGLCGCQRCLADVRALALSRLSPKYVVLPSHAVNPMMSLYQAKFDSTVIAQVVYACKAVMEAPRHTL